MARNFDPETLLHMVQDKHSDYDDSLGGWLNFWTLTEDDDSTWLFVKFHDAETDNVHRAFYEVFPDQITVDRHGHQ